MAVPTMMRVEAEANETVAMTDRTAVTNTSG